MCEFGFVLGNCDGCNVCYDLYDDYVMVLFDGVFGYVVYFLIGVEISL